MATVNIVVLLVYQVITHMPVLIALKTQLMILHFNVIVVNKKKIVHLMDARLITNISSIII